MANFRKLDSATAAIEGKKKQVSIGNIREVRAAQIAFLAAELALESFVAGKKSLQAPGTTTKLLIEQIEKKAMTALKKLWRDAERLKKAAAKK